MRPEEWGLFKAATTVHHNPFQSRVYVFLNPEYGA